jgi:hypothetical protein
MCTTSEPKAADASEADCREGEWDRLVAKIGLLTLSAGMLEAAVMAMHCKQQINPKGHSKEFNVEIGVNARVSNKRSSFSTGLMTKKLTSRNGFRQLRRSTKDATL